MLAKINSDGYWMPNLDHLIKCQAPTYNAEHTTMLVTHIDMTMDGTEDQWKVRGSIKTVERQRFP